MPVKHRRVRFISILALLAGGVLLSVTVDRGTARVIADVNVDFVADIPEISIRRKPASVTISGITASSAHEDRLVRDAEIIFPGADVKTRFRAGVLLPDYWENASLQLLRALGATETATATIRGQQIVIRGVSTGSGTLQASLDALEASVSSNVAVDEDVVVVGNTASPEDLCRRNLSQAVSVPVQFGESSDEIRSASLATLDRIVGVAYDCRDFIIAISGHSDASGDESWNRLLSLARAQAVADYLVSAGIDPGRVQTFGQGSSMPIAANDTSEGRRQNRRIEFDLSSR